MGEVQPSAVFPTYTRYPITMVKGEGSRLWDDTGKEYIDFISGIAVTNLGHVPAAVKEQVMEQLDQLWHVSNLFTIPNQEKLARLLTENSCADAVFFCNSGAEANEASIKLARRYNQQLLGNQRYEIITFEKSFHGRTLATLTATGQEKVKEGFAPLPAGFVYAPYNDVDALEEKINDHTAAIMVEVIQGEGGVHPAQAPFIEEISRLCQKHNLLLIVDEIQTGMGRTGKLFAYEHYGIEPDIITLAKGLGSGFPIGAMLGKEKLREAFSAGSHGSTFGGTPLAMAAGIATINTILEERLVERTVTLGNLAVASLEEQLNGNNFIKEIRGKGLLIGIECAEPVAEIITKIHQQGVLVLPAGPNVIRLLPSLTITQEELQQGIQTICSVINAG